MLRGLTETVLLLADFALDEVTDLRVAIDEVATDLIDVAIENSTIECDLTLAGRRITVCINAIAITRYVIEEDGLGWHVIRTITETPTANIGSYDHVAQGYPVTVEFARNSGRNSR